VAEPADLGLLVGLHRPRLELADELDSESRSAPASNEASDATTARASICTTSSPSSDPWPAPALESSVLTMVIVAPKAPGVAGLVSTTGSSVMVCGSNGTARPRRDADAARPEPTMSYVVGCVPSLVSETPGMGASDPAITRPASMVAEEEPSGLGPAPTWSVALLAPNSGWPQMVQTNSGRSMKGLRLPWKNEIGGRSNPGIVMGLLRRVSSQSHPSLLHRSWLRKRSRSSTGSS
jgi:hypothetical protein